MRKIGLVVDGKAEAQALKLLVQRLNSSLPNIQLLWPLFAGVQPKASPELIAYRARGAVEVLKADGAAMIVVLIDREDNSKCPAQMAQE